MNSVFWQRTYTNRRPLTIGCLCYFEHILMKESVQGLIFHVLFCWFCLPVCLSVRPCFLPRSTAPLGSLLMFKSSSVLQAPLLLLPDIRCLLSMNRVPKGPNFYSAG